jgi:hypothetical protein
VQRRLEDGVVWRDEYLVEGLMNEVWEGRKHLIGGRGHNCEILVSE